MTGWMLYAMWAILGFMLIDFLVGVFRSLVTRSFSPSMVSDYLKDILFYVFPLIFLLNLVSLDPTSWVLLIFYYVCSLAVIWNYIVAIIKKWKA